jgi:aromatic ring hydroxylase
MMIGAALFNARQTGLDKQQAVQEKLALLACYREGINAHLTAAIAMAEESPGGLLMPNQSLLYTGRVLASSQLNPMMHICRELCGGQICLTPDFAAFQDPETAAWLDKYYSIDADWQSEDRRRLLAFARDLLNSDYAGHRLTFQLFAQITATRCRGSQSARKQPASRLSATIRRCAPRLGPTLMRRRRSLPATAPRRRNSARQRRWRCADRPRPSRSHRPAAG